jgi:hypothetical protein
VTPRIRFKLSLFIFFVLILVVAAPAYAYGDPSGGMLFQVLTPIVAALWGAWMAFAHNIHKRVAKAFSRNRSTDAGDTGENADVTPALAQQVEQGRLKE